MSIDVSEVLPEDADESTLEVQHLVEKWYGVKSCLVADTADESEGTISDAVAEFTVESFSIFTITWSSGDAGGGGQQQSTDSSLSIVATSYVYGTENTLGTVSQTITADSGTTVDLTSTNSDLDISGYTLTYATVTYNNETVIATDITVTISTESSGSGGGQGGGNQTSTTYTVTYTDSSDVTQTLVSTTSEPAITIALYYTPDPSISISVDSGNDSDGYTLSAETDSTYTYEEIVWTIDNSNATLSLTSGSSVTVTWADGLTAGNSVTVTATATTTDSTITVVDTYTLTYGAVKASISVNYGTSSSYSSADGATIVLRDTDGNTVATGTTSSGTVIFYAVPGEYTVIGYYSENGTVYECETTITINDDGTVTYDTTNGYSYVLLTESQAYEHIDIKDVLASTSGSTDTTIESIVSVIVYDASGNTVYTSSDITYDSTDSNWQTLYGSGKTHSISVYNSYSVEISYTFSDGTTGTITIDSSTVYPSGTTYPTDGVNASLRRLLVQRH